MPRQTPSWQTSCIVHGLVSSQTKPSRAAASCVQPPVGLQPSSVHGLPSSQFCGRTEPTQTPFVHVSPDVHVFPSSHDWPSSGAESCVQPLVVEQPSTVQGFPSL